MASTWVFAARRGRCAVPGSALFAAQTRPRGVVAGAAVGAAAVDCHGDHVAAAAALDSQPIVKRLELRSPGHPTASIKLRHETVTVRRRPRWSVRLSLGPFTCTPGAQMCKILQHLSDWVVWTVSCLLPMRRRRQKRLEGSFETAPPPSPVSSHSSHSSPSSTQPHRREAQANLNSTQPPPAPPHLFPPHLFPASPSPPASAPPPHLPSPLNLTSSPSPWRLKPLGTHVRDG